MRNRILFPILCALLFIYGSAGAQVKIGDNPQTIDPSSLLELESSNKVLVISRVDSIQMTQIVPNRGAMVYNTTADCVFYYDGNGWINLCGEGKPITADPIVNDISTIVITPTDDGDNIEVAPNSITTDQIVNGSIFAEDLNLGAFDGSLLVDNSITQSKLSENSVGVFALDTDNIDLNDFQNTTGFIRGADIVSNNANNAITAGTDGGAFYDDKDILTQVDANTSAIAADGDQSITNEIQNLSIIGDQLTISGANTITIPTTDGSDTQIIDGTATTVTGSGIVGDEYQVNVADDGITTDQIANGTIELEDLGDMGATADGDILQWNSGGWSIASSTGHTGTAKSVFYAGPDGTPTTADDNGFANDIGGFYYDPEGRQVSSQRYGALYLGLDGGPQSTVSKVHIADNFPGVAYALQLQNQRGTVLGRTTGILFSLDNVGAAGKGALVYEFQNSGGRGDFHFLQNSASNTSLPDIATDKAFTIKNNGDIQLYRNLIAMNGEGNPGDVLTWTAAGFTEWAAPTGGGGGGTTEQADGTTILGAGTPADPFTIAPGTDGQFLTTDSSNNVIWADLPPSGASALFDPSTISGTGVSGDEYTVADNAISTIKILDNNVTTDKIAEGTDGQVLTTSGTDVVWATPIGGGGVTTEQADGTTILGVGTPADPFTIAPGTDGQFLTTDSSNNVIWADLPPSGASALFDPSTISGTGVSGDEYTVADNAISTIKIVDANVTPIKIEPSTNDGEVLLTTGGAVAWGPAPSASVSSDGLTLTGNGLTGTELQVTDNGINTLQLADDAVTTAKIADATILAEDLADMGAADGEILKWNGTTLTWETAADDAGTTYTAGAGLTLTGTDLSVNDLAGDVTGPTSATVIADDAVTTAKINNATILAEDLADMGAADGEILKWNGTTLTWETAADDVGTTYTAGAGLTLTGTDLSVNDLAGDVTGPISATVIADDAVTTAKINNGTILAEDLADMGAADGEILKWNGTTLAWETSVDEGEVTGTTGSVFFADTDGTATENNSQFFWDNTDNKLYVGPQTVDPDIAVKLNIGGTSRTQGLKNSAGSENLPSYRFTDDLNTGMFLADANGVLAFSTAGTEALRIDENQNVGIGTPAPTSTLHAEGSFSTAIRADNGSVTLTDNDHTLILNGVTTMVTLPSALTTTGRIYIVKNTSGVSSNFNTTYVPENGTPINTIPANGVIWLQSDGNAWQQIR
ncbi:beta strand repeat-containing protein [Pareuzebyella sediminis]|uniref:beta strand repeat-containing protein n=1 Tax=Pareuzebyella sediminis TaxID=2607998 RepID=UPI0011ECC100|nr:hypothetical protein [Pareuzebyella sediminis]